MIILMAILMLENRCGGCINHPKQGEAFGATAVEDICDGRQKYVRRPSHETGVAGRAMDEAGWGDSNGCIVTR
jgi:hypothetical protein